MAIAALVVWAVTAAAGLYLLRSVIGAERAAASPPVAPAVPGTGAGRARASVPPGAHPVLEFCHPALGITGLACWFTFVATHDRAFAWVAIAVLVATIGAGLGWLAARRRSARQRPGGRPGPGVPARRAVLHGLIAATTCVLVVVTILVGSHG